MAITLIDDFVRGGGESSPYPLTGHTATAGGSWIGGSPNVISPDGEVRGTGAGVQISMYSVATGSDDYEIGGIQKRHTNTDSYNRTNFVVRSSSTGGSDGFLAGIWTQDSVPGVYIQSVSGLTLVASRTATFVDGRSYYTIVSCSGTTIAIAVKDLTDNLWMNTSGTFAEASRTNCLTYTAGSSTGQYFGVQTYGSQSDTTSTHIQEISLSGVGEQPAGAGSFSASPSTVPDEDASITLALTGTGTTWAGGGSEFSVSGLSGVAKVSETVTDSDTATLVIETTGGTTGTLTITDADSLTTTVTVATASLARTPTSLSPSTTTTVTLTGTNTLWTQETAAGLFSVSGVTGCSISGTPTVVDNDTATISVVTGSSTGTLTITDTSNGATTTVSVASGPQTIPVTNSAWYWSPGNWYSDGGGAMGANNVKGSSTFAWSWNVGAYFRFGFSGASAGNIVLNVDCAGLSAVTSGNRPILMSSLNGAAPTETTLTDATTTVTLATTTAAGTVRCWLKATGTNSGGGDRWTTPTLIVKVTSLTIPADASMVSTTPKTYKMLVYGDSISEGTGSLSNTHDNTGQDGSQIWGALLADALDAEVGIIACDSQGWSQAGIDNVPAFSTAWDDYSNGLSRLSGGLLSPAPDIIVINHGKNGSVSSGTVTSTLAAIRAAAPSAKIYVVVTFDQTNAAGITGATMPDADCVVIDLGTILGVSGGWWLTDGTHPNVRGHARLAGLVAGEIAADFYPGTGGSATSFGTFGSGRL